MDNTNSTLRKKKFFLTSKKKWIQIMDPKHHGFKTSSWIQIIIIPACMYVYLMRLRKFLKFFFKILIEHFKFDYDHDSWSSFGFMILLQIHDDALDPWLSFGFMMMKKNISDVWNKYFFDFFNSAFSFSLIHFLFVWYWLIFLVFLFGIGYI